MPRKTAFDALLERSRFVFRGRVVRLGATNVRILRPNDKTAVVRVEEVLRSNEAMRHLAGKEVTVELRKPARDEAGQTFIFFSNGFLFGENVAVREVDRKEVSPQTERLVAKIPEFERRAAEKPLADRVSSARAVVVGRVAALRALETDRGRGSEHDPDWWVATVEVVSPVKGRKVERKVEVLFANSRDIAWYESPKFRAGEIVIVLLRKEKVVGVPREYFVATHPLDQLPMDRLEEVSRLAGKGGK